MLRQQTKSHVYLHFSPLCYDTADLPTFGNNEGRDNLFLQEASNHLPHYMTP